MSKENRGDCVGYVGVYNFYIYQCDGGEGMNWDDVPEEGTYLLVKEDPAFESQSEYTDLKTKILKTARKRARELILKEGGTVL